MLSQNQITSLYTMYYVISVYPSVNQIQLLAPIGYTGTPYFGSNVQISRDRSRIVVTAPLNTNNFTCYTYKWNGSTFISDSGIITLGSGSQYISSLSLDYNASTFIYGEYGSGTSPICIFYNGTNWTQSYNFPNNGSGSCPYPVFITQDGNTALIGQTISPYIIIYSQFGNGNGNGSNWSQVTGTFTITTVPFLGFNMNSSDDLSTIILYDYNSVLTVLYNSNVGTSTNWMTQETFTITNSDTYTYCRIPAIAAVDGNTFAVSGVIYYRVGTIWSYQGNYLYNTSMKTIGCSLSIDGNILVSPYLYGYYLYARNGTIWSLQNVITASPNPMIISNFVSISGDGTTIAVSFPSYNTNIGEVFVFTNTYTTLVSVIGSAYVGIMSTYTATFTNTLSYAPTLSQISATNAIINQLYYPSYSGNTVIFQAKPITVGNMTFTFASGSITGSLGQITSEIIPVLAQTTLSEILPVTCYNGIPQLITLTLSNVLTSLPTIIIPNGTISGQTYTGNQVTFTWTPTLNTVTVSVSGTVYTGISYTVTAIFSINLPITPTLGTCFNGTVSNISTLSNSTYTFTWSPINTNTTFFNFTNILNYNNGITSTNALTPIAGTIVTVSGIAYNDLTNTITAIFSNNQTGTPTLGTCSNGVVSNISPSTAGTTYTFTWTPTTTNATNFNFTNVTGYVGTLTSTNQLTPLAQTSVIISDIAYNGLNNIMTATFSSTQSNTPTLGNCLNGTVSDIFPVGDGITFTFTWAPTSLTATSFTFTNVYGYIGTETSTNQVTPLPQTTVTVSVVENDYEGINNTITATFSNSQVDIPTLGTCSNGYVSNIFGSGTIFTFTWNPITTDSTSFNFYNITGYSGTLTSTNQLTPIAGSAVSVSGTSYVGYNNTITAVFNNTLTTTPNMVHVMEPFQIYLVQVIHIPLHGIL